MTWANLSFALPTLLKLQSVLVGECNLAASLSVDGSNSVEWIAMGRSGVAEIFTLPHRVAVIKQVKQ